MVSEHIGRYSTRCRKYVNDFEGDLLKFMKQEKKYQDVIRTRIKFIPHLEIAKTVTQIQKLSNHMNSMGDLFEYYPYG